MPRNNINYRDNCATCLLRADGVNVKQHNGGVIIRVQSGYDGFFFRYKSISIFDERFSNDIFHSSRTSQKRKSLPILSFGGNIHGRSNKSTHGREQVRECRKFARWDNIAAPSVSQNCIYTVVEWTKTWRLVYTAAQYVLSWRVINIIILFVSPLPSSPPIWFPSRHAVSFFADILRTGRPIARFHGSSLQNVTDARVLIPSSDKHAVRRKRIGRRLSISLRITYNAC